MENLNFIGIIPARYGSSRLPGKPLLEIGGKSMIERVYERVQTVLDTVLVATDDLRIYDHVRSFNGQAVMTRNDHLCGTDRCLEAYLHYRLQLPYGKATKPYPDGWQRLCKPDDVIINIQGDEPFVSSSQIEAIKGCFTNLQIAQPQIATLVCPFGDKDSRETLFDPNTPKVLLQKIATTERLARILMFSRSVIPYIRDVPENQWVTHKMHYRHIGMYAYRADILAAITQLSSSPLEKAEKLEQLRWLENGYSIYAAIVDEYEKGIDTEVDLQRARQVFQKLEKSELI